MSRNFRSPVYGQRAYSRKFITFYSDKQSNEATAMYSPLTYYTTFNVSTIRFFSVPSFVSMHLFFLIPLGMEEIQCCVFEAYTRQWHNYNEDSIFFFFLFSLLNFFEIVEIQNRETENNNKNRVE